MKRNKYRVQEEKTGSDNIPGNAQIHVQNKMEGTKRFKTKKLRMFFEKRGDLSVVLKNSAGSVGALS